MNKAFEKILDRFANIHRVVKTDEDAEWNRAIYKATEIVQEVAEEYNITNGDKIRYMNDEELAEFLVNFKNTYGDEYEGEMSCLDWLKSEADN